KLRKGLVDDGRWLDPEAREQMQAWISQRPRIHTLVEYRRRLAAVLEARTCNANEALQNLQAWCREAEATGIRALQDYAARLKGPGAPRPRAGGRRAAHLPGGRCIAIVVAACLLPWPVAGLAQVTRTDEYLARMDGDEDGRVSLADYQAWMSYAFDGIDRV